MILNEKLDIYFDQCTVVDVLVLVVSGSRLRFSELFGFTGNQVGKTETQINIIWY